jgi:hypothetical protein
VTYKAIRDVVPSMCPAYTTQKSFPLLDRSWAETVEREKNKSKKTQAAVLIFINRILNLL